MIDGNVLKNILATLNKWEPDKLSDFVSAHTAADDLARSGNLVRGFLD